MANMENSDINPQIAVEPPSIDFGKIRFVSTQFPQTFVLGRSRVQVPTTRPQKRAGGKCWQGSAHYEVIGCAYLLAVCRSPQPSDSFLPRLEQPFVSLLRRRVETILHALTEDFFLDPSWLRIEPLAVSAAPTHVFRTLITAMRDAGSFTSR